MCCWVTIEIQGTDRHRGQTKHCRYGLEIEDGLQILKDIKDGLHIKIAARRFHLLPRIIMTYNHVLYPAGIQTGCY